MKPTELSAHRNTSRRRHAREMRQGIKDCAEDVVDLLGSDTSGYAVVAWTDDGRAVSWWDGRAGDLGAVQVEDHVNTIFRKHVNKRIAERAVREMLGGDGAE